MAVGKSVVGQRLAQKLRRSFVDLDQAIEDKEGMKVHEIFDRKGEAYFRRAEKQTLREILTQNGQVIATGGGVVMDEENLKLLRKKSFLICLTAPLATLLRRSGAGRNRPLLRGENRQERIEGLLRQREKSYAQAHVSIDTERLSVDQVVGKIIKSLHQMTAPSPLSSPSGRGRGNMFKIMRTITVNLGERSYPIHLGEDLLPYAGEILKQVRCGQKVGIITNPTVAALYLKTVQEALTRSGFTVTPVIVPEGEEYKNLKSLSIIYDRLIEERFERNSALIALGGGVVGDLTGFAAATLLRGVAYIQIPTTLLAQVDSSVGGKTGINHREGKNLIGAFYQPRLVLIDVDALKTLPRRELVAGLAEVIKYGIIEDPALFALLEEKMERVLALDKDLLVQAIASSCAIKARVVEKDEREEDYRSVLNFGHTIGHALESLTGYEGFLHGEAVAIGMVQAASISAREGLCDEASFQRIRKIIRMAGLPAEIPSTIEPTDLIRKMEIDKKAAEGKIKFVLCAGIGKTHFQWLSPERIASKLAAYGG